MKKTKTVLSKEAHDYIMLLMDMLFDRASEIEKMVLTGLSVVLWEGYGGERNGEGKA